MAAVAVAIALTGGALLFVRGREGLPEGAGIAATTSTAADRSDAPAEASLSAPTDARREPLATPPSGPTGEGAATSLDCAIEVMGPDGRPVANAAVEWTVAHAWPDQHLAPGPSSSTAVALGYTAAGQKSVARADERGRAVIDWDGGDVFVRFRAGTRGGPWSGSRFVRAAEWSESARAGVPVRLQLESGGSLRVLVTGPAGQPIESHQVRIADSAMVQRPLAWALTNADGEVTFEETAELFTDQRNGVLVTAYLPQEGNLSAKEGHTAYVDQDTVRQLGLSEDALRLTLPPTGSLRVRWAVQSRATEGMTRFRLRGNGREYQPLALRGERGVTFERLPLGRSLSLQADCDGGAIASMTVEGPKVDGELIEVAIGTFDTRRTTARLVDASGLPLRGAEAWVFESRERYDVVADGSGNVTFPLRAASLAPKKGSVWRANWGGLPYAAVVERDRLGSAGPFAWSADLGGIEMTAAQPIVGGQLVDDAGHPLRLTAFEAILCRGEDGARRVSYDGISGRIGWKGRTDTDGRFRLVEPILSRGAREKPKGYCVRIAPERNDNECDHRSLPVPLGTLDAIVRCPRPGRVELRVSGDGPLAGELTRWRLKPLGGQTGPHFSGSRMGQGHWIFPVVAEGRYRIEAIDRLGDLEPVATTGEIVVRPAATTEVPFDPL